jgi:hypothetical protein
MTLPHLGMTWIDMGLSADQAKPRSVRRAGFKGYVAGSDWEEQEEENGHGHSDLDEDLYDQVRPNPTSHGEELGRSISPRVSMLPRVTWGNSM